MSFDQFSEVIKQLFPDISEAALEKFRAMEALYADWNSKINVISRKDMDGFYSHHVLHSLAIAGFIAEKEPKTLEGLRVLDLGTGGGFPGIPMAILFPNTHFTLCDSVGKKIKVATEVAKALNLNNVETINARAEALPEKYDMVITRAVADMTSLYRWTKGTRKGPIYCLKGGDIAEESANLMGTFHLKSGSVHTWPITPWISPALTTETNILSWFDGKFVVKID